MYTVYLNDCGVGTYSRLGAYASRDLAVAAISGVKGAAGWLYATLVHPCGKREEFRKL